jgi:hypothetical protein
MRQLIGVLSGVIVGSCTLPYGLRVYQKKTKPNLVSWSIWTILGLAILLSYGSSGAKDNIWPAVGSFVSPLVITILLLWRGEKKKPEPLEVLCGLFGLVAIVLWWFLRTNPAEAAWALYVSIAGDACALVPTIRGCWKDPNRERPLVWMIYAVGYGLAMFAISEPTFANYILPIYMVTGASLVAIPLVLYRLHDRIPLSQWI